MKPAFVVFFLLLTSALAGQGFTVSVEVTDATCQANGAITVLTEGGSGDFRYTLSNDCGNSFPPQSTPDFTTLVPCTYRISVEDRSTGEVADRDFVLEGVNEPLSAVILFSGCDGTIEISGGNGPYTVSYVAGVVDSNFTTTELSLPLPPLNGADVTGTVVDDCGNSRNINGAGTATAIGNFGQEQTDTALVLSATGGQPPYTFVLQSSAGTFSNQTGIFPWPQVGCAPTVAVSSVCAGGELTDVAIELDLGLGWNCVSFADGFADVRVTPPNRGPYTYTIEADGIVFTQTDSLFTGLPVNAASYTLTATDACGQAPRFDLTITRYQLDLLGTAEGCSDDEVALRVDRQCSGPLFTDILIYANDQVGGDQVVPYVQSGSGDTTFISGQPIGSWDFTVEDDCGDGMRCQDELRLEAVSACDSIVVNLVQVLTCDNGTFSRRPVDEPSAVFTLEDAAGTVLETGNTTGRFTGITAGTYLVRAASDCGAQSISVTLSYPVAIDPFFDFFPRFDRGDDGVCRMTYGIRLGQAEGPFVLTGGPGGAVYELFNDFDQDICTFYDNDVVLAPGTYTLTSFSSCGSVDFTLPEIVEPRIDSVAIRSNCPGSSSVEIFSTFRSNASYRAWWLAQGIRIGEPRNLADYYYVNNTTYRNANFIDGLEPGIYTLSIVPRFSSGFCPIDTFTLVIPEYEPVALTIEGDVLCDTSGSIPLQLFPERGNGPYVIREVNCADPTTVLASYDVAVGQAADIPVVTIGTYCFVVEDICGITADFQVEVRSLTGAIETSYDCSPQLILATDTLPGTFRWFAADGTPLGGNTFIRQAPPLTDTEYTLEVDIGTCVLRETVAVAARPVLPGLSVLQPADGEVVQCDTDTVVLIAATDTFSAISWDEPFTGDTLITQRDGVRRVTATNDLGCTTTEDIVIRRVISPAPVIGPRPDFCFGDTLALGIDGRGSDGRPLAGITWSSGALDTDSILISGTAFYGVSVTDIDGCTAIDSFTFVEPGPVDYRLAVDSVSCFDARDAVVRVLGLSGGTPAFVFDLSGRTYLPGEEIVGLDIGEYRFRATDSHGCALDTAFRIGQPDSLAVSIGEDRLLELATVFDLPLATNADTLAVVSWSTVNPLEELGERLVRITALETGVVGVVITDQLGCTAENSFRLTVDRGVPVYVASAFSPNGDGVNDRFVVQGLRSQILNVARLEVFDRWGNQHFGVTDLGANDFSRGWDGTLDGRAAPVGLYVWQAEVTLANGERRALTGEVMLVR